QLVDIAVVSTLLFLSEGLTSPFFAFFTFILLATALRWRSRGLVATAAVLAVVLLVASIVQERLQPSLGPGNYEFNRVFIRGAYLVVIGGMLAYVTTHRDRCRDRLARLAHWPVHEVAHAHSPSLEQTLVHAAGVLSASRILVVWEEAEEPFVHT